MHTITSSQQMWWLGGKGVDLHPWGSSFNSHKWHGLWLTLGWWSNIPYLHNQQKVIRMDVTCPFCIRHHVDVGPNGLVSFIRMEILNFSFSLDFSFRHMGIENKFGHHNNNNWKNWLLNMQRLKSFSCHRFSHKKILITKYAMTKTFQSSFLGRPNLFNCHLWNDKMVLVAKLRWAIKIRACIANSFFPLRCVGFMLFNKQWLPYTLGVRGETFMNVWSFKLSYCICNWC